MTSAASRKSAQEATQKPDSPLELDPDAAGPGLRDWLRDLSQVAGTPAVAFDTRVDAPAIVTGRASRGIAKRLRQHGFRMVAEPESFLVTKDNQLVEGEAGRAVEWASTVLSSVGASR
ncbi:MAG: flavodoxin, partial [Actinomycetota bacterium]|nr:flavodoxin [Actinomycetota bacterium]